LKTTRHTDVIYTEFPLPEPQLSSSKEALITEMVQFINHPPYRELILEGVIYTNFTDILLLKPLRAAPSQPLSSHWQQSH
jgi:hypothetical protein